MSDNKLTAEQMRVLTVLSNIEKKARDGGPPLPDHENMWREMALMALLGGRDLKDPYLPEDLLPEPALPGMEAHAENTVEAGVIPEEEFNAMTAADVENAEESDMTDEEIQAEVRAAMTQALQEEGLWEEYQAAKEKHKEVWVNSTNGIIFGYRKLKFKDIVESGELDSLMDEMKMVTERCVVLNKEQLIGEDPSAYVYEMIYNLVRAVSNARPDMPYSVKL